MKQGWQKIQDAYDALTTRERGIIALLLVVLMVVTWSELFISSVERKQAVIAQQIASMQSQVNSINKHADAVIYAATVDPNKTEQVKLDNLKKTLSDLDEVLRNKLHGMISPADMARAVEAVLTRNTSLKLISMKSLAAEPLFDIASKGNENNTDDTQQLGVYKHGLQMEFTGSYLATLKYLQEMEKLPWDFYWDSLKFKVEKHPESRIVIKVYTLSLDKEWIGVG